LGSELNITKDLEIFKDQLRQEMLKELGNVDKKIEEAYKKGRQEAEMKEIQLWIPSVDQKLVERAKKLEFICLSEIKASHTAQKIKDKVKERVVYDTATKQLVIDDEAGRERDAIKWLEWQSLFADLLDLYLVHGGHVNHLPAMLTHFRLWQRLGKEGRFTFESLQKMDRHIRSRPEGQGPNFTWRFDGGPSKALYLDDYKGSMSEKRPANKTKGKKRGQPGGVCFEWFEGKECKFAERCKYSHSCSACQVTAPRRHDFDKCSNKATVTAKKKVKASKQQPSA